MSFGSTLRLTKRTPLTSDFANFNLKSGNPAVLKRLQNRFTLGSLTFALLAKLAMLDPVADSGSDKIASATFRSELFKPGSASVMTLTKFRCCILLSPSIQPLKRVSL